jgi:hypothetical protein
MRAGAKISVDDEDADDDVDDANSSRGGGGGAAVSTGTGANSHGGIRGRVRSGTSRARKMTNVSFQTPIAKNKASRSRQGASRRQSLAGQSKQASVNPEGDEGIHDDATFRKDSDDDCEKVGDVSGSVPKRQARKSQKRGSSLVLLRRPRAKPRAKPQHASGSHAAAARRSNDIFRNPSIEEDMPVRMALKRYATTLHEQADAEAKDPSSENKLHTSFFMGRSQHEQHQQGNASEEECVIEQEDECCFPKQSARDACMAIIECIQRCNSLSKLSSGCDGGTGTTTASEGCDISLDSVLSTVPFRSMLQDLFAWSALGADGGATAEAAVGTQAPLNIPLVAKSYEEMFMREPMHDHERHCVNGPLCEGNFIGGAPGEGFTFVEFILPGKHGRSGGEGDEEGGTSDIAGGARSATVYGERVLGTRSPLSAAREEASAAVGKRPAQMCVLCHRREVQRRFYDMLYAGVPFQGVIQRYGNICNQENEYAREVMLICPPNGPVECMPFPVASHQRNRYSVYLNGGVRYAKQSFMGCQDFYLAPPSSGAP